MQHDDFKPGGLGDDDETESHITPNDIEKSVNAPAGVFVDVPRGMVAVPGAEVDDNGVLRKSETGELAVWHHRCAFHGKCERYTTGPENFVREDEVVYINGAPWCPDCVKKEQEDVERKQFQELFREKAPEN